MSETVTPTPAKSRVNRWLAVALIASVAINLGFAGFGAVRFFKYKEFSERRGWQIEDQVARRLPDNAAQAFRQAFEEGRKGGSISHHQMRRDLAVALGAEPYDHNRLAAVLDEHRRRLDQLQAGMQAGMLAAADAMTPEQRQEFAERMLRRGPKHLRGEMPPPPPPPPPPRN